MKEEKKERSEIQPLLSIKIIRQQKLIFSIYELTSFYDFSSLFFL